ncbi:hypothetical protein MIJ3_00417 [Pseudomonas phage vB_PaeM_MIJ3]|nr:hypothetical protein MIJ3_00417 [Pseudomonas phage vB_PaeM_MIJ3]
MPFVHLFVDAFHIKVFPPAGVVTAASSRLDSVAEPAEATVDLPDITDISIVVAYVT